MFKVSVIIPVYNAENYLEKAVMSAVELSDVKEVLLIDDASPDNSGKLCDILLKKFDKVKVFRHPNNENRGAGASRNLGLQMASCDYIAFLDADDYYLPNRFDITKHIFERDKSVDGIYETVGVFFYTEKAKEQFAQWKGILTEGVDDFLERVEDRHIKSENLLMSLLSAGTGRFHTDGITFKKELLKKTGMFNPALRLHQDTDLWLRMAYSGKLVPGKYDKPVAIRGVHEQNRIHSLNINSRKNLYTSVYKWFLNKPLNPIVFRVIFKYYINNLYPWPTIKFAPVRKTLKLACMAKEIVKKPIIITRLIS
ncbi:glycosyltransferase family 2 protein [Inquilinus sp. KBS0705]|nr:glycosyltransferase family 2 protein [Inquilinus sp. KBS0705]